jgi:hypothetical protein
VIAIRARGRAAGLALVAALLLVASACGYSSRRLAEMPGVQSIAVVQFENATYRRDLEFRLTQAVAEEVRARTPWRIATPATADVVLSGTIRSAETSVLAERDDGQSDDKILERYRVEVDCRLLERATGRELRAWTSVARQEFSPHRPGESLEGSATDGVTRSLAQEIVQGLERPIGRPGSVPPPRRKLDRPFPR